MWKCTLGLDVVRCPEARASAGELFVRATVELRGAWNGELTLSCPGDLARSAAALFFGREAETVSDAEAQDAVGELANMTGGNLKAVLPGPCSLSTPRRGPGRVAPSEGLRVEFASGIRPFWVELIQEERS